MPDNLWAPWRMSYIKTCKDDPAEECECFICNGASTDDDRACLVVARQMDCVAILNRFPYNNGHVLIAPCAHKADFNELTDTERLGIMKLVEVMQERIRRTMNPHGFNIGANIGRVSGAGLPGHLHVHIVPRWNGDTNFMPVIGDTKVIPQALEAVYDLIKG